MTQLLVRVPDWLIDQTIAGASIRVLWLRRLADADLVGTVSATSDTSVSGDHDVVVDGAALMLDLSVLAGLRGAAAVLETHGMQPRARILAVERSHADTLGTAMPLSRPDLPVELLSDDVGVRVTDTASLVETEAAVMRELCRAHIAAGVRIVGNLDAAYIASTVTLEAGATLWTPCTLLGTTHVAAGATVHPGCHLTDTRVDTGATLRPYTVGDDAHVGPDATVGPFAHLRTGTVLERGSKVGNFVETKKTRLGEGAKANHLSYLGDATVGAGANIGAGTITCNYDGARKHRTTIGAGAFIGTNSSLVAPLTIGDEALVAAGAIVTRDVPAAALTVVRAPQKDVEGKGKQILERNRALKAAKA
jgi:acetyltransferase-like isoleucine patch superfamily enzyme